MLAAFGLALRGATVAAVLIGAAPAGAEETYPVGLRQIEFADHHYGDRTLSLALFYPAAIDPGADKPAGLPFFTGIALYRDAKLAPGGKRPLIMLSHGRGSNGLQYAWLAQTLAAQGYIVAAPYHWRANSYDATVAYLANKIWQRPVDVSLDISSLLADPLWGAAIDAGRIGAAGHSQGGFTALWLGGAKVNRDKFLAFQQGWRNNPQIPASLREALPLDPTPALDVADARVKAVFAMAPGVVQAFGMDEAGLKALSVPAYIIVGAGDTQTPPAENAEFAAKFARNAKLDIIPGRVNHEIFVNECDEEGKNEFPEACIDAPGVDRAAIHAHIGNAALDFFGSTLGK